LVSKLGFLPSFLRQLSRYVGDDGQDTYLVELKRVAGTSSDCLMLLPLVNAWLLALVAEELYSNETLYIVTSFLLFPLTHPRIYNSPVPRILMPICVASFPMLRFVCNVIRLDAVGSLFVFFLDAFLPFCACASVDYDLGVLFVLKNSDKLWTVCLRTCHIMSLCFISRAVLISRTSSLRLSRYYFL